jgi:hypothetical protein
MTNCRQCGVPILFGIRPDKLCVECRTLKETPDPLSNRKDLGGIPFQDLKQNDEDERIKIIVNHLIQNPGKIISVMVDYGPAYEGKGDRYAQKVLALAVKAKLVKRIPNFPVEDGETLNFRYDP